MSNEVDVYCVVQYDRWISLLVAGALGGGGAAPSLYPQALAMFTTAGVQQWLFQAQSRVGKSSPVVFCHSLT